jgi:hypothetical protein
VVILKGALSFELCTLSFVFAEGHGHILTTGGEAQSDKYQDLGVSRQSSKFKAQSSKPLSRCQKSPAIPGVQQLRVEQSHTLSAFCQAAIF